MKISIQALLILVLLVAAPLGGYMNRINQTRDVVDITKSLGGIARLNSEPVSNYSPVDTLNHKPPPEWVKNLFGPDAYSHIDEIKIEAFDPSQQKTLSEILRKSNTLRSLRMLTLKSTSGCEFDFKNLRHLKQVRILQLQQFILDGADIDAISQMDGLELLLLKKSSVDPADLSKLNRLPQLSWLLVEQGAHEPEDFESLRVALPKTHINVLKDY